MQQIRADHEIREAVLQRHVARVAQPGRPPRRERANTSEHPRRAIEADRDRRPRLAAREGA